jgi:hypothetical protein
MEKCQIKKCDKPAKYMTPITYMARPIPVCGIHKNMVERQLRKNFVFDKCEPKEAK